MKLKTAMSLSLIHFLFAHNLFAAPMTIEEKREMRTLINQARAAGYRCGNQLFNPASPLVWRKKLKLAAQAHSDDMAANNYFAHISINGEQPDARITEQGYSWWTWGENIAAGYPTVAAVVQGWLESPGHCANIMNPDFQEFGAAKTTGGSYGIYWTQDFASPR